MLSFVGALGAVLTIVSASVVVVSGAEPVRKAPAGATRPNVVELILDDLPADAADQLLERMPRLGKMFLDHGITFTHADGNDPQCCPARAGLLTGLRSDHHGVTHNDARLFDPSRTLATALRGNGYWTALVGKYLNHSELISDPPGWSHLAINIGSYFDNWRVDGVTVQHPGYDATVMGDYAMSFLEKAPASKPVFLYLAPRAPHGYPGSIGNTGWQMPAKPPNIDTDDPRCASLGVRATPAWDEVDVSDKPQYVKDTPRVDPSSSGYSLRWACYALLEVDRQFDRIRTELVAQGRFDNTVFVLLGDNGVAWGDHRLCCKETPYTTPVPLYLRSPAMGDAPSTRDQYVQLIDIAPTIADLAGVQLGPFASQPAPDGVSLRSVILANAPIARDVLVEEHRWPGVDVPGMPAWWALRTTDGHWHYVEYDDGERELYDLQADPWELDNRAGDRAYAVVQAALAVELAALR